MKAWLIIGLTLINASISAIAGELQVGIYCPDARRKPEGIFLALQASGDMVATRYVAEINPAGLNGLDVLIVPQVPQPQKLNEARDTLRSWVADGHGLMTIHDAVGYRQHPVLFPEFARGSGNPFDRETGYGKDCIITLKHPATQDFQVPAIVTHAYFDQVVLECGAAGVVLAREGVVVDDTSLASGEPVIVTGSHGKGRYVANGLAIGTDESGKHAAPQGDELKLFTGLVRWLGGEGESPQASDLGSGIKIKRGAAVEAAGHAAGVAEQIARIRAEALEPWPAAWLPSDRTDAPAILKSNFRNPIEFPPEALRPSGYNEVADGWTRINLRDEWRCLALTNTAANAADNDAWFAPEFDDHAWEPRAVPAKSARDCPPKFTGVAWYRRVFPLPTVKQGQRVILTFTRCGLETKLWVNGKYIGLHVGGTTPFEFDITDAVAGGQTNVIAARVFDLYAGQYDKAGVVYGQYVTPDGQTYTRNPYASVIGHLWGEVYLTVKPELYAVRTLVTPRLSTSEIEIDTWLYNAGAARKVSLDLEVTPAPPALAKGTGQPSAMQLKDATLPAGVSRHTLRLTMHAPVLWTTDNPYLYRLEIKNGPDVLARERFGFREFAARGPYFFLNGKKINLIAFVRGFDLSRRIEIDNDGLFLTRYLLAQKQAHVNTFYPQTAPMPRQFYYLCDELGMLVYSEWNMAHSVFSNIPMAEGWNKGESEALVWMAERYNHPSAVMTSLGGELFERQTPKPYASYNELLNPLYNALKAMDKQLRPICPSSGRDTWRDPDSRTDVHDFHAYPGGFIAGSWTDEPGMILRIWAEALTHKPPMPVIQYEMDGGRVWNEDQAAAQKLLQSERETGRIDRGQVIKLFQQQAWRSGLAGVSSIYGFRRYLDDIGAEDGWRAGAGWQIHARKNVGQASRIMGPLLSGFCPNTDTFNVVDITETGEISKQLRDWMHTRLGKGWQISDDLAKKRFVETEAYRTWQRVNNPALICLDRFDRNILAGGAITANVYVINDIDRESGTWNARYVVRNGAGKTVADRTAAVGKVGGFKRRTAPITCAIPPNAETDFYRIELYLYEGTRVISDNYEDFFVLGKADQLDRLVPDAGIKMALYDSRAQIYQDGIQTRNILDQLKAPYTFITNFTDLADFNLLVIGADSMDETVRQSGDAIRAWMEQGGRLLQFEQHIGGSLPYWRKFRLISVKPYILAEIIEANHPVFKKLNYRHMENWSDLPGSRTPGEVYRMLVGPIDDSVLASGSVAVPRENNQNNQMAMAETVVGKGRLIINQFEATQRYGQDAAATRLIWNLLEYAAGKGLWKIEDAPPQSQGN